MCELEAAMRATNGCVVSITPPKGTGTQDLDHRHESEDERAVDLVRLDPYVVAGAASRSSRRRSTPLRITTPPFFSARQPRGLVGLAGLVDPTGRGEGLAERDVASIW